MRGTAGAGAALSIRQTISIHTYIQVDQLLQTDFVDRAVELVVQLMLEKGYEKAAADSRLPHRDNGRYRPVGHYSDQEHGYMRHLKNIFLVNVCMYVHVSQPTLPRGRTTTTAPRATPPSPRRPASTSGSLTADLTCCCRPDLPCPCLCPCRSQAKDLLEHNFPFLRVAGLQRLLQKHRNRYYPTMMEV